jgi:hypothetical protein
LLVFDDGIVEDGERPNIMQFQNAYAGLQSVYTEWKELRNAFCTTFGIEYDDLKQLENKYIAEEEL